MQPADALTHALPVVEAAATLAFAASGLVAGARRKLDVVGLCVVTTLAAFGGGTLRDVLLDRRPFYWVEHSAWLWVILGLCLAATLLLRKRHLAITERAIQWPDALGLGLFTAVGTQLALAQTLPPIVAVLMGVITAVFGGVLRDIACNEVPKVFSDHQPYAVCAFLGGWVAVAGDQLGWPSEASLAASALVTCALRVAAMVSGLKLPGWRGQ
ncbi:hypothetical protein IP84_06425 [beta proteobacterium AAP99]|nr:hypothetical protein IP84_06425 [beta proteobacterium AAP99]